MFSQKLIGHWNTKHANTHKTNQNQRKNTKLQKLYFIKLCIRSGDKTLFKQLNYLVKQVLESLISKCSKESFSCYIQNTSKWVKSPTRASRQKLSLLCFYVSECFTIIINYHCIMQTKNFKYNKKQPEHIIRFSLSLGLPLTDNQTYCSWW